MSAVPPPPTSSYPAWPFWCYQAAAVAAAPLLLPLAGLWAAARGRGPLAMGQRCGALPAVGGPRPRVWLHAASVGEVRGAQVVVEGLADSKATFLVTTVTGQGYRQAHRLLGSRARVFFAPLDLLPLVRRAVDTLAPDLFIGLETELWPALLHELRRRRVPALLLNGRLSARSFNRLQRIPALARAMLGAFQGIAAITADDAHRFRLLGGRQVTVCGNLKYAAVPAADTAALCRRLSLDETTPVLVCGSLRSGEEEEVVQACRRLRREHRDLVLLLAPRHLERLGRLDRLLAEAGLAVQRYSQLAREPRRAPAVLVDTMGDLAGLYQVATVAFCGGSLVPKGGHNIMEPATGGCPVLYGPHMDDFIDARRLLEDAGCGFPVTDGEALAAVAGALLRDPTALARARRAAREVARGQQQAATRQLGLVREVLAQPAPNHT